MHAAAHALRRPAGAVITRRGLLCRSLASKASSGRASREEVIPDRVVNHAYVTGGHAGRYMPGFSFPAPRSLESIIKYALLERESATKIKTIWEAFHEPRFDSVASVWSADEFSAIQETKRRCPRFVFPILKGDGKFFTLFAEWQVRWGPFACASSQRSCAHQLGSGLYRLSIPRAGPLPYLHFPGGLPP